MLHCSSREKFNRKWFFSSLRALVAYELFKLGILLKVVQTTDYKAIIINQIVIDVFLQKFFRFWMKINSPPGPLS